MDKILEEIDYHISRLRQLTRAIKAIDNCIAANKYAINALEVLKIAEKPQAKEQKDEPILSERRL